LKAVYDRTTGDVSSLRTYALGFPDRQTGAGTRLLAGVGAGDETRNSADIYLSGRYSAFGREHEVTFGASGSRLEADTPLFTSIASWSYTVPNAWNFDGNAPQPVYARTGAYRVATTDQWGVYASTRFRMTDALSLIAGTRVTTWETGTDNYNTARTFTNTTGAYRINDEITPYIGLVHDINQTYSLYASYTDVFRPQTVKDKNNDLLEPVLGSNIEAGIKGEFLGKRLIATLAVFKTGQDNYAVRDSSQPEGSLPDGSSAYIGVDGTRTKGVETGISGNLTDRWIVNAGYTYVETTRHKNDLIYTNLPEHYLQLSTHVQLPGMLDRLTIGGGVNWQSQTAGYNITHPTLGTATFRQGAYALANLHATWRFNPQLHATLSATNLLDESYWANIDYANYGEPRNVSLTMKWRY
jgi:outer membrane receptor for ferric coprogen and ferric-rhodotorulic acid